MSQIEPLSVSSSRTRSIMGKGSGNCVVCVCGVWWACSIDWYVCMWCACSVDGYVSAVYDCATSSDLKGGFQCHLFTTPLYKDVAWTFQLALEIPFLIGGRCVGVVCVCAWV